VRRFIRFLGRVVLGTLACAVAVVLVVLVIHGMQLYRLHRLKQTTTADYVFQSAPYFVLSNARVIDGSGGPALEAQNIVVRNGVITWTGPAAGMPPQPGARIVDSAGTTIIPGLVMMHEHLFTSAPGMSPQLSQQSTAFPLLYLASGVTTARTAGSVDPEADLRIKQRIDDGTLAGPELFLTAPYLEGQPALFPQMRALTGPEDAKQMVDKYSAEGFTSFKAYADITPEELQAAIAEAHARSARITGHLCSITFTQAAQMGIDNLEHGLLVDTEFYSGKKPNQCPPIGPYLSEYRDKLDVTSPEVLGVMNLLISHHVALTSTLAVFEGEMTGALEPWYAEQDKHALTWQSLLFSRMIERASRAHHAGALMKKAEQFEHEFVARGGTLLAGADPTGDGSTLAGFADLREIEMLVDAGFTPPQAIQIATQSGANFLGIAGRAGTIAVGKQANLVVIAGNPAQNIADIRKVRAVYKRGIGYDSAKMVHAVDGVVGLSD